MPVSGGRLTLVQGNPHILSDLTSDKIWLAPIEGDSVLSFNGTSFAPVSFLSGPDDQTGRVFYVTGHLSNADYHLFDYAGVMCSAPMQATTGGGVSSPSGTPGLLTGTPIGGMQLKPAAFNGVVNAWGSAANSGATAIGYAEVHRVGLDFGPGASVVLTGFTINSPSDDGFRGDGAAISYKIQYTDDGVTWADFYAGTTPGGPGVNVDVQVGLPAATHRGYSFIGSGNSNNWVRVGEAKFYGFTPSSSSSAPIPGATITRKLGIPVNAADLVCKANSGPVTVPAYRGTHLGSFRTDASGNTITAHRSYGPDRRFPLWNRYHQEEITLRAGILFPASPIPTKPTGYYPNVYTPTWAPIDNNPANCLTVFQGEAQEIVRVTLEQGAWLEAGGASASSQYQTAIGFNSTSVPSGTWGQWDVEGIAGERNGETHTASFDLPPMAGATTLYALAQRGPDGIVAAWVGERDLKLSASWWG